MLPIKNNKLFYFSLILFYLTVYFGPGKPFYFLTYFISALLFYLSFHNLALSLIYSLILALFFDIGLAARYFLLEPQFFDLGSGYLISPMTIITLFLLLISLKKRFTKHHLADKVIFLFLAWCLIFFIFFPQPNIFYGLLSLVEIIIIFYLFRLYFQKINLPVINTIIISLVVYQIFLSIVQTVNYGLTGIIAETINLDNPFSITAIEDENLSRISGSFGHPNFLAAFIVTLLPLFIYFFPGKSNHQWGKTVIFFPLFFTFSRIAWLISLILTPYLIWIGRLKKLNIFTVKKVSLIILLGIFLGGIYQLYPLLITRIMSLPLAFEESGSFGIRIKLVEEAVNIISSYPLTGVGLNYSLLSYIYYPVTDLFSRVFPGRFYKIHNTFLEILSETGLVGSLLFILFLILPVKYYLSEREHLKDNLVKLSKTIIPSWFNITCLHFLLQSVFP